MKPSDATATAVPGQGTLRKVLGAATLVGYALLATPAHATTMLVSDTTLVTGSDSTVFSFEAPGSGTVSVQLTNLDWPQALSSLSFMASTTNHVMSSWSDPASMPNAALSFQVIGGGRYFTDVMATAGGPLDLGAYSFCLSFTPTPSPVALPASGVLLLGGLGLLAFMRWRRGPREGLAMSAPAAL